MYDGSCAFIHESNKSDRAGIYDGKCTSLRQTTALPITSLITSLSVHAQSLPHTSPSLPQHQHTLPCPCGSWPLRTRSARSALCAGPRPAAPPAPSSKAARGRSRPCRAGWRGLCRGCCHVSMHYMSVSQYLLSRYPRPTYPPCSAPPTPFIHPSPNPP